MQLTDFQYLLPKRKYVILCKQVCFVLISPIFSCWVTYNALKLIALQTFGQSLTRKRALCLWLQVVLQCNLRAIMHPYECNIYIIGGFFDLKHLLEFSFSAKVNTNAQLL